MEGGAVGVAVGVAVDLLYLEEEVVVERGSTNNKDTDCNHRKLWMTEGKIHRFENSKTPE